MTIPAQRNLSKVAKPLTEKQIRALLARYDLSLVRRRRWRGPGTGPKYLVYDDNDRWEPEMSWDGARQAVFCGNSLPAVIGYLERRFGSDLPEP